MNIICYNETNYKLKGIEDLRDPDKYSVIGPDQVIQDELIGADFDFGCSPDIDFYIGPKLEIENLYTYFVSFFNQEDVWAIDLDNTQSRLVTNDENLLAELWMANLDQSLPTHVNDIVLVGVYNVSETKSCLILSSIFAEMIQTEIETNESIKYLSKCHFNWFDIEENYEYEFQDLIDIKDKISK
jgi:hypothetical protein